MSTVYEVATAAAAGKDMNELDALQDSSTHSFTDVCSASAFFNSATQKISPLHTTLVEAANEEDDREEKGGSREETAELYLDSSFSGTRIKPILKLPGCSSSAPVAVSQEPYDPLQLLLPFLRSHFAKSFQLLSPFLRSLFAMSFHAMSL
jgi:hypothetical protein